MNTKKRKNKQIRKQFLQQYSAYINVLQPPLSKKREKNINKLLCDLMHSHVASVAVINYVSHVPSFEEWCKFIQTDENANFYAANKTLGVSWLHSAESLKFLCDDILKPITKATKASYVCCVNVLQGLNEACMYACGTRVVCQSALREERFIFIRAVPNLPAEIKQHVIYMDMRLGMQWKALEPYVETASCIVFAGPMCLLPFLYRINDFLIQKHEFQRRIFKTFGISADRVVFDGDVPCTCAVVYYHQHLEPHLPCDNILETPTDALRQHYLRHALSGAIPDYWKLVLAHIPLKTFLTLIPHHKLACPFDTMLIQVFGNGSLFQENDDQDLPLQEKDFAEFDCLVSCLDSP